MRRLSSEAKGACLVCVVLPEDAWEMLQLLLQGPLLHPVFIMYLALSQSQEATKR